MSFFRFYSQVRPPSLLLLRPAETERFPSLQIFASSMDKSHVYQLVQQLEFSPNWTTVVCQRVGDVGGPPSPEFEISKSELEGLVSTAHGAILRLC